MRKVRLALIALLLVNTVLLLSACSVLDAILDAYDPAGEDVSVSSPAPPVPPMPTTQDDFARLFAEKISDVQVSGAGVVTRLLADDEDGDRHQRFIIELPSGQTLMITHNIDIAPRLDALKVGDTVEFYGEYVWNEQGGLVHWTHLDPNGSHVAGYLKFNEKIYQ
jgi:hypothetical protein